MSVEVVALYSLIRISDPGDVKTRIAEAAKKHDVLGAITVAGEGINGTIAANHENMSGFLQYMRDMGILGELEIKYSTADKNPFVRMRLLLRQEIVTMGYPDIIPGKGTYVEAKDWNDLISDPDVVVLDTRNDYEVDIGTFEGAINPNTESFKEFPVYVNEHLDPSKNKKIAMFCTGGIRCEKASSYMLAQGFEEVYHLKGGILKYLEDVPAESSRWRGECYVFDQRVAVKHGLEQGSYIQCRSCRHPLNVTSGETTVDFEEGVCCKYCIGTISEGKKAAARERNLQMDLAKKQKRAHLGTKVE
jgi:UPF0176 protein